MSIRSGITSVSSIAIYPLPPPLNAISVPVHMDLREKFRENLKEIQTVFKSFSVIFIDTIQFFKLYL